MENADGESRRRPTVISFRVTPAEARLIEAAAEANDDSRAGWCRQLALRHARAAALADSVRAVEAEIEAGGE